MQVRLLQLYQLYIFHTLQPIGHGYIFSDVIFSSELASIISFAFEIYSDLLHYFYILPYYIPCF